jgi:hypothetical protein
LITKMVILGIVGLVVIAIALSPSPGNVLHQAQSMTTPSQTLAQSDPQSMTTPSQTLVQSDPVTEPVFTSVAVVPGEVVVNLSQTFTVEVWINNVTDMAGWQIRLVWSRQIIKCVKAQINTPPEWGGVPLDLFNKTESDANKIDPNAVYAAWLFAQGIENDYSDTCGQYVKAECYGPHGGSYRNPFNGSIAVVTFTFQAVGTGSTSLGLDAEGIVIGNSDARPIAHTVQSGLVEVQMPL